MNRYIRNAAVGMIFSFALGGGAHAYQFAIDSFQIYRGDPAIFFDTFADGIAPAESFNNVGGVQNLTGYTMTGSMGPENVAGNSKLFLNESGAVFNLGLLGNTPVVSQSARLNTNTNNADLTSGLKIGMDITVIGRFDLIAPGLGEFYGIRLDDRLSGVNGGQGNDIIDVRVRNTSGTPVVQFRSTDQFTDMIVSFELALDLGHSQIELAMGFDPVSGSPDVLHGGFRYVDGGIPQADFTEFGNTFNIFHGENFTRAGFIAGANVPEPTALALFSLGLAGLGFSRRKKA